MKKILRTSPRTPTTARAIYPNDLLSVLEDPTQREGVPVVTWQGKVLPPFWCSILLTSEAEDSDMVELFLNELAGLTPSNECEEIISIINKAWRSQHPRNTFQFIKKKELIDTDPSGILSSSIGINKKGTIRDDDHSTKQKEGSEHGKACYHPWFDNLLEEMALPNDEHCSHFPSLLEEPVLSEHPMDELVLRAVFSKRRAAAYANKVVNLYSRLGGSYLGDNHGNSNHSSFSLFPLYGVSTDENGVVTRRVDGICIRAPHHAVKTTDKVQFITIERVTTDPEMIPYLDYVKKPHHAYHNGVRYLIRQNSIQKSDPPYLTFVLNSLFVTSNLAGELIFKALGDDASLDQRTFAPQWINQHKEWLMERIVEGLITATTAGAQEEGSFLIVWKMFMMMPLGMVKVGQCSNVGCG